jgi:hypothetical protein
VGCGPSQKNEDFVPAEDAARAALEAYLKAWAAGDKNPTVPGTSPAVQVVDDYRGKGRTLTEYAVLGPVPADAPRCFAVRLTLGNPREEVRERYVIVGLDPVWVWRYDDYEMIAHWEHRMPDEKDKKAAPPAKR